MRIENPGADLGSSTTEGALKIGELATLTQTPVDTIRYYERAGLLTTPMRTAGKYRSYSKPQTDRLNFMCRCRGLDMSIDEVRTLLHLCDQPQRDCGDVNAVLDKHIGHVEVRLAELRRLAAELRLLRAAFKSSGAAASCRILGALRAEPAGRRAAPPRLGHRSHP